MSTSTSPGSATGSGTSPYCSTSGPPCRMKKAAFIDPAARRPVRTPDRLLRPAPHGRGPARQLHQGSGVGDGVAVDPQHRDVVVEEVADVDPAAVGAEHHALGHPANLDLADL